MAKIMEGREEQEALTYDHHSYTNYYVQSPSSVSLQNSALETRTHDPGSEFQSPTRLDTVPLVLAAKAVDLDDFPRSSALSRYSDGSWYDHHKELMVIKGMNRLIIVDGEMDGGDDDDEEAEEWRSRGWRRYLSFRSSDSGWWIALQIGWRLVFSLGVALLVFYFATQPPPPNFSVQIGRVRQFILGEGVDSHGVTTKILTCNCSIKLIVENKSKVFGLHIHPPSMDISFGRIVFATSQGPKLYAESHDSTTFHLHIGTKNKPMYGAGRDMEDMLKSSQGLLLRLRMNLTSDFRVIWKIINPKFHHQAECSLLLGYDERHKQVITTQKHCRLVS